MLRKKKLWMIWLNCTVRFHLSPFSSPRRSRVDITQHLWSNAFELLNVSLLCQLGLSCTVAYWEAVRNVQPRIWLIIYNNPMNKWSINTCSFLQKLNSYAVSFWSSNSLFNFTILVIFTMIAKCFECLLCARCCSKHLTCVNSFHAQKLVRSVLLTLL